MFSSRFECNVHIYINHSNSLCVNVNIIQTVDILSLLMLTLQKVLPAAIHLKK